MTAAYALQLPFRDDPDFVGLVAHRVAADRYEVDLDVADMRCANCAGRIERALTAIDGIERVRINPAQHRVVLDYDPNRVALSAVFDAVSAAGYTPMYVTREVDDPRARAERRRQLKGIAVAALAMMQVMMFSLPLYVADADHMSTYYVQLFRWSALVFTTPVVLYSARPFFDNALASFAGGALGRGSTGLAMDVPVALAIGVAFVASAIATVRGVGDVYFDSITMFVFLLLGARFLEQQARRRLGRFDHWLALLPETARRETNDGVETISLDAIRAGDRIVVPSGSRIAVDGDVVAGTTQVDEATLTGESRAVAKTIGARVFAGTLNVAQPITVVATKRPAQTRVADIHRLAQRATLDKPRVAVQADAVARHFVAAVLTIAAATFVFWHFADSAKALPAAIAVLVVSCPCALSLATPMAITVATLALRRRGFVITRAHVLERLARIKRVIFDKTGTLTGATPELVAVEAFGGFDSARAVQIARALEHRTDHPLSAAFATTEATPTAANVRIERGKGISGEVDGIAYRLGNAEYCHVSSAPLHPDLTTFYLATVDAQGVPSVVAEFAVRMALRDDVGATLKALARLGVDAEICTGDRAEPTRALAAGLGIPFSADATPEAKLAHVRELADRGVDVAMVGDGINDVPGLAAAAVSIAPADGTDLARAHSDAVLLAPGIGAIAHAIVVARAAQRIVRQNLTWAAAYNLIAIPLAVMGALPPWAAAIGMSASSLGVTLNALRLVRADKTAQGRSKEVR